jgi:NADPH:quinone reductase
MNVSPTTGRQIRSLITSSGSPELSVVDVEIPALEPDDVLVRVEAAPINPSDLATLVGYADLDGAAVVGPPHAPLVTAPVPASYLRAAGARVDIPLPTGNEGAGTVIAAGASPAARALVGKTVSLAGGGMYAQYRVAGVRDLLVMPDDIDPVEAASSFVNPMTALGFVETMRREGHTAMVNTAAASNLGQMLVKLCGADDVGLVNIVRNDAQVDLLRSIGADQVCNSTSPTFTDDLVAAIGATGATIGFDAVGGGRLANAILTAMEAALNQTAPTFRPYGSSTYKQMYIYGALDPSPTELTRSFGLSWGIGGWLVRNFLASVDDDTAARLRERVVAGLRTTFASAYTRRVSLVEALDLDTLRAYRRMATGEKYLITPNAPQMEGRRHDA